MDNLHVYEDENETFCAWSRIIADDIQPMPYALLKKDPGKSLISNPYP